MIKILLVDDSNDKIAKVITTIRELSETIKVEVVVDFISAQNILSTTKYDLLILDMNLPVREGEKPSKDAGKNLLNEVNRKKTLNSPGYIICLTQYPEENKNISNIWPSIKYSPENDDWKQPINDIIKHILKCQNISNNNLILAPTIFFEGKTDEKIIREAIMIFKPEIIDKIILKSEKSFGGASWVARQVIAWSYSLNRGADGEYLKSIGLLDGDLAGKSANEEINRVVKSDGAESKTFHVFKLSLSYARHMLPIKQKGLDIPICLEEMFETMHWKHAHSNNWLELRNRPENFLTEPKKWNGFEITLKDYLSTLGLNEEEKLYLNCFNDSHKDDFAKYILNLDPEQKKIALKSFEKLVQDISIYLLGEQTKQVN